MRKITNITADPSQRHILLIEDEEIIFNLRFYPTIEMWAFNIEYKGLKVSGSKISLGVLHISNSNFPFDFAAIDKSGNGIDPFKLDDFHGGRCSLFILDQDDMENFRGVPVAL
jgi:hypothetical protein